MNVAFSAMLAFMLLIPGFVFLRVRRATSRHSVLVTSAAQPFSVEIAMAIAIAVAIHVLACTLIHIVHLVGRAPPINFEAAVMLLSGHFGKDEQFLRGAIGSLAKYPFPVAAYFFFTLVLGGLAGKISNELPKTHPLGFCLLDQRELVMDEWGTFFRLGPTSGALITAVVEMGGKAYLFLGTVRELRFNAATAELERIELEDVAKRLLDATDKPMVQKETQLVLWPSDERKEVEPIAEEGGISFEGFEWVPGNQFVLRMSEIKTLNVIYFDKQISAPQRGGQG